MNLEERITWCCVFGVLLLFMVFLVENFNTRIYSLQKTLNSEIAFLTKEVRKKTVPHFSFERGNVYSGSGEIVIEK